MAQASVKLMHGSSFRGHGHHFGKAETKIMSDDADIAYFSANPRFRVSIMKDAKPVAKSTSKTLDKQPDAGESDVVYPWHKAMKKAQLIEAAESRDIAVTPEDKIADIVQLLREWDEENGGE